MGCISFRGKEYSDQEQDALKSKIQNGNTKQISIKEGVDFVFEQTPELSNIGTP